MKHWGLSTCCASGQCKSSSAEKLQATEQCLWVDRGFSEIRKVPVAKTCLAVCAMITNVFSIFWGRCLRGLKIWKDYHQRRWQEREHMMACVLVLLHLHILWGWGSKCSSFSGFSFASMFSGNSLLKMIEWVEWYLNVKHVSCCKEVSVLILWFWNTGWLQNVGTKTHPNAHLSQTS